MGRGQGKRGREAGERIRDRGEEKRDNVKVKLLNYLITIITEILFFLFTFVYCEIGSDVCRIPFRCLFPLFRRYFSLSVSPSLCLPLCLSLCLSLLVCQHDVLFFIYLNVCHEG